MNAEPTTPVRVPTEVKSEIDLLVENPLTEFESHAEVVEEAFNSLK